jgi:membrane protein
MTTARAPQPTPSRFAQTAQAVLRFLAAWLVQPPRPAQPRVTAPIRRNDWKDIVLTTLGRFGHNQIPLVSAGVTFYVLLAVFPALNAVLSIYSLFASIDQAQSQISQLYFILPSGGVQVINDAVSRLSHSDAPTRSVALAFSVLLWLWSANAGVKAFFTGLNITYGVPERRSLLVLNLESLAFTVGGTLSLVFAMILMALEPLAKARSRLASLAGAAELRWPILFGLAAFILWLLYRFGAGRAGTRIRSLAPGVMVSAFLWVAGSALFAWYVGEFGNFNRTYGSLGAVVGFMTWIWLSVQVALFGADLNVSCCPERSAGAI